MLARRQACCFCRQARCVGQHLHGSSQHGHHSMQLSIRRASVQDMTTDGSSGGAQQLQPGLRQAAGRQRNPAGAAGTASQPPGQPHTAAGVGAIAFASAGTLDKPTPTPAEQPGTQRCTHASWAKSYCMSLELLCSRCSHSSCWRVELIEQVPADSAACTMMLTGMHGLPLVCEESSRPALSAQARPCDADVSVPCSRADAAGADGAGVAAAAAAVQAFGRNGPVPGQEGASGGGGAQAGDRDFGRYSALLPPLPMFNLVLRLSAVAVITAPASL